MLPIRLYDSPKWIFRIGDIIDDSRRAYHLGDPPNDDFDAFSPNVIDAEQHIYASELVGDGSISTDHDMISTIGYQHDDLIGRRVSVVGIRATYGKTAMGKYGHRDSTMASYPMIETISGDKKYRNGIDVHASSHDSDVNRHQKRGANLMSIVFGGYRPAKGRHLGGVMEHISDGPYGFRNRKYTVDNMAFNDDTNVIAFDSMVFMASSTAPDSCCTKLEGFSDTTVLSFKTLTSSEEVLRFWKNEYTAMRNPLIRIRPKVASIHNLYNYNPRFKRHLLRRMLFLRFMESSPY